MKSFIASRNLASALSTAALLAFAERTLLDWRFVEELVPSNQPRPVAGISILYMLFFSGWIWAILAAKQGSRPGIVVAFLFTLVLSFGLGVGTLTAFCPSPCRTIWPLMETANWANLVLGLVASIALGLQWWRRRT